jgi:hypothetical protein
MYSFVTTCIRPNANAIDESTYEQEFDLIKKGTGDTMNDESSSSKDCSQSSNDQPSINSDGSYTNIESSSSTPEKGVQAQSSSISSSLQIQSPSRVNRTMPSEVDIPIKSAVKQVYSPLCDESTKKVRGKSQHELELISRMKQLMTHNQRWKFQSQLCGNHAVPIHVLDLSRREVSPETLKFGVTPQTAFAITDLTFNSNILSKYNLPSLLDTVVELFPNLEHLSFINDLKDCDSSEEYEEEGLVYSADEPDDVKPTSLSVKVFVPNLDKINLGSAEKYRKDQAQYMQRLYILYRIPRLKSINRKLVSDEEYRFACPSTGKKLPELSRRLFDLRADSKLIIFDADGNNSDCKLSTIGVEMTLNQHFCSDSPLVKKKKSPESVNTDEDLQIKILTNDSVPVEDNRIYLATSDRSDQASSIFSVSHINSFEENDGKEEEVSNYKLQKEQMEEVEHETCTSKLESVKNSSPTSIQPSNSNLSTASILISNIIPFEGKDQVTESQTQPSLDKIEQDLNASHGVTSTGGMKKKLPLNQNRSFRPPPSPASVLKGSQRKAPFLFQRKNNSRPSSILPLNSLFDEESSDEEEE